VPIPTIPASAIVSINPAVIGTGGSPLALNGVFLTQNAAVPIGSVLPFSNAAAVSAFFGPASPEYALAQTYFAGRDNAPILPGTMYFAQYNIVAVSAYLRGGSVAALTLAQLQALAGVLTVTVDGLVKTSSAINLTAASSFSNAATIIQAAFTALGGVVSYDAIRGAFVVTSATNGVTSNVSIGSGTIAAGLGLTTATGAVLSQGAAIATPAAAMVAITAITQNFAAFMTIFEPVIADKLAFSAWTSGTNKRYIYVGFDSDVTAAQANVTTSWGAQCAILGYDGSVPVYGAAAHAAFVLGCIASIDFTRTEGRITFAFKSLAGLAPTVTDQTTAANLTANGYNFYGSYATANQGFNFFYPGLVSGKYNFLDEYVNEIYLNNAFQLALMSLLTGMNSIPYNAQGYGLIDAALQDPINAAVNFGSIRPGVALSAAQAAQVNTIAGSPVSTTLATRGWYAQIQPATAQIRGLRQSPPINFFYLDGGSVQKINVASIVVQ
jgi:hypothetical protein